MVDFMVRCQPHTAAITTKKGKLPLHFAAGDGHASIVKILLSVFPGGASMASAKGKIPLHFAARWGHLKIAQDLLDVYPESVSTLDWEGSLPLHDAAREGQFEMSRFLLDRFPLALAKANLRGEIPLFPAVMSRNSDLIILFVQAWPIGGKHVLMNVSADDNIKGWKWDIVELLLRGAVGNLSGCRLLASEGRPAALLGNDLGIIVTYPTPETQDCKKDSPRLVETGLARHAPDTLIVPAPNVGGTAVIDVAVPRSKSPILEEKTAGKKRRTAEESSGRKQPRRGSTDTPDLTCGDMPHVPFTREKTFIPLHAALECGSSSHVIRYVLTRGPEQVEKADDLDRLPLHLAVAQCRTEEQADLILDQILKPFPEAALCRDAQNRLPLHIAIASQANDRVIAALLNAYPTAGVEPCRTDDEWHNKMPMHMACHYECGLSAVYLLLRADPSSILPCHA